MSPTRYSIVVTCHNQQQFIRDAVESALSQAYASREVIVVDDGSEDGSLEALRGYVPSVELISLSTSLGAIEARNRGAAVASGEYLIFLDGDDVLAPWALEVHERVIAERRPTTVVSGARWFEGTVPTLSLAEAPERLEFVEYESLLARDRPSGWYTGGFVVSRLAFHAVGGWSADTFYMDLMDLAAKLRSSGTSVLVCSPYTMLYRMHSANSLHDVPKFIAAAHQLMHKERTGRYPRGHGQLERFAWYAGMIVLWAKKGFRGRLYRDALWLVACGSPSIVAAIIRGLICRLRGRRHIETRTFGPVG